MKCPKCEFETTDSSCPRCGVVFEKLGRERAPRRVPPSPHRVAPARPERSFASSLFNIVVLTVLLCSGGYYGLKFWQGQEPASPLADVAEEPLRNDQPAPVAELDIPQPEPLVLGSLGEPSGTAMPDAVISDPKLEAEIPELPRLTEAAVTPVLLARAEEVAREHPGVEWLREYVIAAYLLAAGKEIRARRYREALRYLDDCEDWGPPPGDIASFRAVIYAAEEEWEPAMRWAETAIAYGSEANPAEMYHIIGKSHYYREEMKRAIEAFETALDIRDDPTIRASLQRALQEARAAAGYDSQRLAHFIVRYEGASMEDTGRMVIDTMDRSYASLVSQLGFEPSERVVVILYSRRDYREMGGPHWSAGLFDGKIRVPVRGLERLDEHIKTTLHHELAHAFIHAKAGKAAPRWLHEGLAEYVEGTRTEQHGELLARVINSGQSFEHCLPTARCDVRLFYPAAASMVDYMIQRRGMGAIRDVLTALGEGHDIDASLNRVLGSDVSGLIRDWEHFIRRRY